MPCGRTLARAHARSGDPAIMAGYMGGNEAFDDASLHSPWPTPMNGQGLRRVGGGAAKVEVAAPRG